MRVFVSYPSERREAAESIAFSLRGSGHSVFLDKDDLPPGKTYDDQIRKAIQRSDMVVFLMSPEAFEANRYTLSELAFIRVKWPSPKGHVLPVLIAPVRYSDIPAYLTSVTFLEPQGNVVAEVAHAIERMRRRRAIRRILGGSIAAVASAAVIFGIVYYSMKLTTPEPTARFALVDFGERVLQIGESETFRVVNETPEAAQGFTCQVQIENPNVEAVNSSADCSEVRVTLASRPFVGADGALLPTQADGATASEIPVSIRLLNSRGDHVGELRASLQALNALDQGLRIEGAPDRMRLTDAADVRATYAGGDMPEAFSCRAESRHFDVAVTGRCAFRLTPRPAAFTAAWLDQGNVQPGYVTLIVRDAADRTMAEHLSEIDVGR